MFYLDRTGIPAQMNGVAALRHGWQHQVYHIFSLVFILLLLGSIHWRVICCCCAHVLVYGLTRPVCSSILRLAGYCQPPLLRYNLKWMVLNKSALLAVESDDNLSQQQLNKLCSRSCVTFNFDSDIWFLLVSHIDGILFLWLDNEFIYEDTLMPCMWWRM